jgi:hypothetical protein
MESQHQAQLFRAIEEHTAHLPAVPGRETGWRHRIEDYARELWERVAIPEAQLELDYELSTGTLSEVAMQRALWHIRRLSGFGGSDMSALYTEYQGGVCPFHETTNARSVIQQKLLGALPAPASGAGEGDERSALIRGKIFEGIIERSFLRATRPEGLTPDTDALRRVRHHLLEHRREIPWLYGMPDGLYLDASGRRWLVDFKAPGDEDTIRSYLKQVPQYYEGQLGHYALLLKQLGVPADITALVPYSYQSARAHVCRVEVTPEILRTVEDAGNHYWYDNVLQLALPEPRVPTDRISLKEISDEVWRTQEKIISLNAIARRADALSKEHKKALEIELHRLGYDTEEGNTRIDLGILRGTPQERVTLDGAALKKAAREKGIDVDDPRFYKKSRSFVLQPPRSNASLWREQIDQLSAFGGEVVNDALVDLNEGPVTRMPETEPSRAAASNAPCPQPSPEPSDG